MKKNIYSPGIDDQIAYLREALELHVLEVSDIVQWADDQILARENPAYELIELALMSDSNRYDTSSQLLRVGTPSLSRAEVLPYVLAKAHEQLLVNPDFGKVLAEGLYQSWYRSNYDFPDALRLCGYFEDAYSLAESGTVGTVDQIYRELLEFTARFQDCNGFESVLGQ
ncbi:hypothetical protein KDX38_27550 [Pseudomonas sp. CDFA 602]|uniref:hypothetical protein n=1 Tax=Pseudomonas californiensis TaxID=2829823 RepID=UPI001E37C105|nr:hypothetical protein [Pseudomonas californiensis]MCD5997317.1 hypothetical protein [Pseudomonas californiensis]MCD6002918.1 hypothetical protein [Pseudomonas californiensis]